jgi:putative iron-dependent peroxidase
MPFGRAGQGEFGTYFIGYSRSPRTMEQMLENMFVGRPTGNYDRLLDFSRAVTGNLFFAPSADFLDAQGEDDLEVTTRPAGIAPLKGENFP